MLEVDLDNPQELHKSHNDHPLAAEKINVSKKYAIQLLWKNNAKT